MRLPPFWLLLGALLACAHAPAPVVLHVPRLFVSDEVSGDVTVLDLTAGRAVQTIHVGKRPRGVRLSPDHRLLYVAVSGSPITPPFTSGGRPSGPNPQTPVGLADASPSASPSALPEPDRSADGLVVVDTASGQVLRRIDCGADPENLDLTPDGKVLAVSNEDDGTVTLLDTATGRKLAVIPTGAEPEGVRTRPDGKVIYVTSEDEGTVTVVDTAQLKAIATFPAGQRPRGVAFTSDGKQAFVTGEQSKTVTFVDAQAHKVLETLKIEGAMVKPMGVVISPDDRTLYVGTGRGGGVAVIDVATRKVARMLPDVGKRPWWLAVSSDGQRLYTANGPSNDVSVVDLGAGQVLSIAAGRGPWAVALDE